MEGKKEKEYKYCVCQDFESSFTNAFLAIVAYLLGHPVTSSVPFATEVFVKKVKITEQIVYVACSLVKV